MSVRSVRIGAVSVPMPVLAVRMILLPPTDASFLPVMAPVVVTVVVPLPLTSGPPTMTLPPEFELIVIAPSVAPMNLIAISLLAVTECVLLTCCVSIA